VTEATAAGRRYLARLPAFSTATFRWAAWAALVALFAVTVSGATVRLTGSGLGCENWPRCGDTFLPAQSYHALIEFGNRVVGFLVGLTTLLAALAAWRARVPRRLLLATLGLPLLVLAQGVLGGITVLFELHPLIVMGHFLLSLVSIGLAVLVVAGAERLVRPRPSPALALPGWTAHLTVALLPLAAILVVTGAFVTAAGPHSGGTGIERLGDLEDAMWVHVRVSAVFGVAFLALVATLQRYRDRARKTALLAAGVLALLLLQMVVGEVQWRNQLPWQLVLGHVTLATLVWTGVVALAVVLRRPRDA
jgi:cytochrome c oxidase assembly protein subunit 15